MSFWFEVLACGILRFIGWIVAAVLIFIAAFGPLALAIHISPWYMTIYFGYLFILSVYIEFTKRR